jgi:hypothetical protein
MAPAHHQIEPEEYGYSLANLADLMFPCLEAIEAESVAEVGAFTGSLTQELLAWAPRVGARITAIDPNAEGRLVELAARHPTLELLRERSHDALRRIPLPDALIFDGDHNYYAVSQDLNVIEQRTAGDGMPLLIVHDAGWPHGRRDVYFEPEAVPEEHRQPMARDARVSPGNPGLSQGGLGYEWIAEREGGPRNGVLTALEDFVESREQLRLAVVPAFFGFGILWHEDAPWAEEVARILAPYDRNRLLQRLEANRVAHLVARIDLIEALREQRQRLERQRGLLNQMLGSRAFALAERLSRLRQRSGPVFSREEVRRVLDGGEGGN